MLDSNTIDVCPNFETLILDYFDRALNEPDRQRVEMHVASCAKCRAFWQEQKELDAILSAGMPQPALAWDFKQHLIERAKADQMESATRTRTAVDLEAEMAEVLTRMQKTWLERAVLSFLDGLGVLTVAAVVIMFCYELLTRSALLSGLSSQQISFYGASTVGLGALLGGVCFAFRDRIRSVLEAE